MSNNNNNNNNNNDNDNDNDTLTQYTPYVVSTTEIIGGAAAMYFFGPGLAASSIISSGISGLTYTYQTDHSDNREFTTYEFVKESVIGGATSVVTGGCSEIAASARFLAKEGSSILYRQGVHFFLNGAVGTIGSCTSDILHGTQDASAKKLVSTFVAGGVSGYTGAVLGKTVAEQGVTAATKTLEISTSTAKTAATAGVVGGMVSGGAAAVTTAAAWNKGVRKSDKYLEDEDTNIALTASISGGSIGWTAAEKTAKINFSRKVQSEHFKSATPAGLMLSARQAEGLNALLKNDLLAKLSAEDRVKMGNWISQSCQQEVSPENLKVIIARMFQSVSTLEDKETLKKLVEKALDNPALQSQLWNDLFISSAGAPSDHAFRLREAYLTNNELPDLVEVSSIASGPAGGANSYAGARIVLSKEKVQAEITRNMHDQGFVGNWNEGFRLPEKITTDVNEKVCKGVKLLKTDFNIKNIKFDLSFSDGGEVTLNWRLQHSTTVYVRAKFIKAHETVRGLISGSTSMSVGFTDDLCPNIVLTGNHVKVDDAVARVLGVKVSMRKFLTKIWDKKRSCLEDTLVSSLSANLKNLKSSALAQVRTLHENINRQLPDCPVDLSIQPRMSSIEYGAVECVNDNLAINVRVNCNPSVEASTNAITQGATTPSLENLRFISSHGIDASSNLNVEFLISPGAVQQLTKSFLLEPEKCVPLFQNIAQISTPDASILMTKMDRNVLSTLVKLPIQINNDFMSNPILQGNISLAGEFFFDQNTQKILLLNPKISSDGSNSAIAMVFDTVIRVLDCIFPSFLKDRVAQYVQADLSNQMSVLTNSVKNITLEGIKVLFEDAVRSAQVLDVQVNGNGIGGIVNLRSSTIPVTILGR